MEGEKEVGLNLLCVQWINPVLNRVMKYFKK